MPKVQSQFTALFQFQEKYSFKKNSLSKFIQTAYFQFIIKNKESLKNLMVKLPKNILKNPLSKFTSKIVVTHHLQCEKKKVHFPYSQKKIY